MRPGDLPRHFCLSRPSVPFSLGNVPPPSARPSPNHTDTFPARTGDLPHEILLWRCPGALLLGKVKHPFGEGLLFPRETFPITSASHALLCHFLWGRSHPLRQDLPQITTTPSPHAPKTFPKRLQDCHKTIHSPSVSPQLQLLLSQHHKPAKKTSKKGTLFLMLHM